MERFAKDRGRWRFLVEELCCNGNSRVYDKSLMHHQSGRSKPLKTLKEVVGYTFLAVVSDELNMGNNTLRAQWKFYR